MLLPYVVSLLILFFTLCITVHAHPSDTRVRSYLHTLPQSLVQRIIPDLQLISKYEASLESLPSYKRRTRWYPKGSIPRMPIEEAVQRLINFVESIGIIPSNTPLVGAEWWTQIISSDAPLGFHVDKDESIATHKYYLVHPVWSSVFYLSDSGGGTLIPNQYSPNGNGYEPVIPTEGEWSFPTPNKFLLFRGDLLHGVIPGSSSSQQRTTFLINFWSVVPEPPNCELLPYHDVKGLVVYDEDEMEEMKQQWDHDGSEKRSRQALAKIDMTESTSLPYFDYKITLPGGSSEEVRLPKNTKSGQTYTITWKASPSSSSSYVPPATSQSSRNKATAKKRKAHKTKKSKSQDDDDDEEDEHDKNDTTKHHNSIKSSSTSASRRKWNAHDAKNDLIRRIKEDL